MLVNCILFVVSLVAHPSTTAMEFEEILRMASSNTKEAEKDIERRKRRQQEEEQRKQKEEERRRREQKEAQIALAKQKEEEERRRREERWRREDIEKREKAREQRERDRPKSYAYNSGGRTTASNVKQEKKSVDLSFDALLKQADTIDAKALRVGPSTGGTRSSPALKGNEKDRDRDREDRGARRSSRDYNIDISRRFAEDRNKGKLNGNGSLGGARSNGTTSAPAMMSSRPAASSSSYSVNSRNTNGSMATSTKPVNSSFYSSKTNAHTSVTRSPGNGSTSSSPGLSARERLKVSALAPPQRLNMKKRDLRSVEEIQEDMSKRKNMIPLGATSGSRGNRNGSPKNGVDHSRRGMTAGVGSINSAKGTTDRNRLTERDRGKGNGEGRNGHDRSRDRERERDSKKPAQISRRPSASASGNDLRRGYSPVSSSNGVRRRAVSRSPPPGRRRFSPDPPRRRPMPPHPIRRPDRGRRGGYYNEDDDDDMDSFIDDDDEEEVLDERQTRSIIGRMFNYDRKRFRDEDFSDDDMEAGASDVLREEQQSAKLARLEDLREEQREREELERARQRKLQRNKDGNGSSAASKEKKKTAGPGMIDL